jgi:Ca2+-binding RTX toxin-like protein
MSFASETVSFAGGGIVFNNSYDAGVTASVRSAIITAENYLQAHFTDRATVNITFDYDPMGPGQVADNLASFYAVSYAQLVAAMTAHATSADDRLAVAGLPTTDPSNGAGFAVAAGQGQALGLFGPSGQNDVVVHINSNEPWTFGSDLIGAIEHEVSEGVFGRIQSLGTFTSGRFTALDLFRFNAFGLHDFTGGGDGLYSYFGPDGGHLDFSFFHNAISVTGANDGQDFGDWDYTAEDAFGGGGGGAPSSISAVDLQVLDVIGWTPSGAPPGSGPDDYADSFTDTSHPFGQLTVGAPFSGTLQAIGDRDWFKVTLEAGKNYVINLTGQSSGGGTLDDPLLVLHDSTGAQIAFNDNVGGGNFDSRLLVHPTATGVYYVDAESLYDETSGSFTLSVQAGAPASTAGNDVLVGSAAGGTIMAGAGDDTIAADNAQNYLRGEEGDDVIDGGSGFDDINGNQGNDTCHGWAGDDWVVGGKDNDMLFGDSGDDIVWGNLGNDTLSGGSGADQVRGGQGDDSLSGGSGDDYISGDRGADTETGGAGADIFHSFSDAGIDRVLDFNVAEGDKVMLDPGASYTVSQVGADTVIDIVGGAQMILVGVQMSSLPPGTIFLG